MFKILTILLIMAFGMLPKECVNMDSSYGLVAIESTNGKKFYFRREARGLNYDSLSLSKNPDYCLEPDPSSDIIFKGMGPIHPFYKFEAKELHLYLSVPVTVPANFTDSLKIIQHELTNPEFLALRETYKSKGLELIEVPLDESLHCP